MAAAFPDIFNTPGFDTPGAFNTDGRITSGQRAPPPPKLTNTTRPGWMVWTQLFDAYLSMYNTEAHDALTNGLANVWARKALYVLFIQAVAEADQSLFLEMAVKCNKDGYDAYHFYDTNIISLSHAGEIKILTSLFGSQVTDEVTTAGKQMRFQNEQLSEADRLSDKVLVMALLTKLPDEYTEFVKINLHGSQLPTFSELLKSLEDESTINSLRGGGTSRVALISRGGGKPHPTYACRNCAAKGDHFGPECPKPIVQCGVCNRSGHMEQFCWVKNKDMKLPDIVTGEARANIYKMREAYHKGSASANFATEHEMQYSIEQDANGNSVMVGRKII